MKKLLKIKVFIITEVILVALWYIVNFLIYGYSSRPMSVDCGPYDCEPLAVVEPFRTQINWVLVVLFFSYILIFIIGRIVLYFKNQKV